MVLDIQEKAVDQALGVYGGVKLCLEEMVESLKSYKTPILLATILDLGSSGTVVG